MRQPKTARVSDNIPGLPARKGKGKPDIFKAALRAAAEEYVLPSDGSEAEEEEGNALAPKQGVGAAKVLAVTHGGPAAEVQGRIPI